MVCVCLFFQGSAISGVVYDHIYLYLHNTLKAVVKPVCKIPSFTVRVACLSLLLMKYMTCF